MSRTYFKSLFCFNYMYVLGAYMHVNSGIHGCGGLRCWVPLELMLQVNMSHLMSGLGCELRSSVKAVLILNC